MRRVQFKAGHTFEGEVWSLVPSLPTYEASSYGRLRRVPWVGPVNRGVGTRTFGGVPTYGQPVKGRHIIVVKDANGKGHSYKVHRLVCEAFHGLAPFDRAVVMHLDEDFTNNRPGNLKWGTQKENLNAPGFKAYCRGRTGDSSPTKKHLRRVKSGAS